MKKVKSIEQLQQQSAEIRSLRCGFITNFFFDPVKHGLWIAKGDCHSERKENTLFIIKQSPKFWNVFFCSTTIEDFSHDLSSFMSEYPDTTMMFDIVGRDIQCQPLVEMFLGKGYKEATSLVRMTKMTTPLGYTADNSIRKATEQDIPVVSELLHTYFDEQTEQIPYDDELMDYAHQGHILICEEENRITGFLIYELNTTTLYLRYWFTHPDYRDKKVGSRLLRRFFEEGKNTKRQLFWVIRTNENAIVRYRHYGFAEENMFDYVMQFN
ncbi:MAG: GNAT family N-acetyltransferase [Bacteroidales bacterium]|nr:GNAT family N-acetyltransferase [Bacteroidales bacterium]